jgi:succinoglycan biosynthesis protein ExoV
MKFYVSRGAAPNFGDELNRWLLPRVFPNLFDGDDAADDGILFLGIGSILYNSHPFNYQKVVFGAGFGGYTAPPKLDHKWHVYCVRGPRTAATLGLSNDKVAADTALLINLHRNLQRAPHAHHIAFIPHFESAGRGHWQQACRFAGLRFIDPRAPVEEIIVAIEASSVVMAEAMHGAIVADALRVPWIPVLPLDRAHRQKWLDWAETVDISLAPARLWPSSAQEVSVSVRGRECFTLHHSTGALAAAARRADKLLTMTAAAQLSHLARKEPMLSSDLALNRGLERLETQAAKIRKDFAR